ncbi:solute carrier family 2, facilitated glucose transporter member 12 isoform X1 [Mauremys mutica]|uniref:solute carrier family 2, facilitated glucose transporter member 12 isoform X1 n=1 Tax=Mauremys mutica TaxID=74926 RepID=UPI001D16443F|nr:solute carrier family 2, facilitated glucose transporter member 12 isoform X1 [Mauremys mutica]
MVPVQNVEDLNQQCRKMRTGESDDNRGDSSSNANLHKLPSQTVTWLVLSEIFPGGIRGRAMALTSSMNWGINLLISLTFLTVTDLIGLPWVCFIYSIMSLASLAFIIVFIPETKGCSLEQISMELAKQKYTKSSICWMGQRREKLVPTELPKRDPHEPFY